MLTVGFGDNLIATGEARGPASRGKRAAFGDGKKILWDQHARHIFAFNPHVALPGSEGSHDLEWIAHYKGNRLYNKQVGGRWVWNYDFHATPGQIFFSEDERTAGRRAGRGFVVMEPNVPRWKTVAHNKDWGFHRYQEVADWIRTRGVRVVQFNHGNDPILAGAAVIKTTSFRDALAVMSNAWLYVGPEGGLHHGAAALSIPGVVLFGGFIPPSVTGYPTHVNLTGGSEACGSLQKCEHCRAAMAAISIGEVTAAVHEMLGSRLTPDANRGRR